MIAIAALGCVTFPVGSWDKRFVRDIATSHGITEKQIPQLWRLFIRYRRQIDCPRKVELLDLAAKLSAPDLRKQQAMERAKAVALDSIEEMRKAALNEQEKSQ